MKQNITPKQLNELSKKGKEKLGRWWYGKKVEAFEYEFNLTELPLLSIGQMIEFLDEYTNIGELVKIERLRGNNGWIVDAGSIVTDEEELIDNLWEAVKEILEKNEKTD